MYTVLPGRGSLIHQKLSLPYTPIYAASNTNIDSLKVFRDKLGLKLYLGKLCNLGRITGIVPNYRNYTRLLLETITFYNGRYCRFFILVNFGLGCTIWFGSTLGIDNVLPYDSLLFQNIESYRPFIDQTDSFVLPGFKKATLIQFITYISDWF